MNTMEQFAKISPFVNESGIILIKDKNKYYCNKNKITLKDREIGICISFKNKEMNEEFLNNGEITIIPEDEYSDGNERYMVQSLVTMIDGKVVKLAGAADSASIDQFPGHDVDIYAIDPDAFKFELTDSGTSYKLVGLSKNGIDTLPIIDENKIILPYEYKGEKDDYPLPVTMIEEKIDEDNGIYSFEYLVGNGELNIYIPYSVDMISHNFPSIDEPTTCKLILSKHVLIF